MKILLPLILIILSGCAIISPQPEEPEGWVLTSDETDETSTYTLGICQVEIAKDASMAIFRAKSFSWPTARSLTYIKTMRKNSEGLFSATESISEFPINIEDTSYPHYMFAYNSHDMFYDRCFKRAKELPEDVHIFLRKYHIKVFDEKNLKEKPVIEFTT